MNPTRQGRSVAPLALSPVERLDLMRVILAHGADGAAEIADRVAVSTATLGRALLGERVTRSVARGLRDAIRELGGTAPTPEG